LWNFERPKTVVKVKKSSIESKRMKRDIHNHATSVASKMKVSKNTLYEDERTT